MLCKHASDKLSQPVYLSREDLVSRIECASLQRSLPHRQLPGRIVQSAPKLLGRIAGRLASMLSMVLGRLHAIRKLMPFRSSCKVRFSQAN